jgi:hypothetical protein
MTRCAAECDTPEQRSKLAHGQVRAPVRGHQQHPIRQGERPWTSWTTVGDGVPATAGDHAHQAVELSRA